MLGTILAVLSITLNVLLGYFVLIAQSEREEPKDAKRTRKRREEPFVTHEELEAAIERATKELTFEWNEWYEKFDKLHLRLAKRAKRSEKGQEVDQEELGFDAGERPSVVHFRRIGSV